MTTHKEALTLALEALEDRVSLMKWQIARDAVKEALAQQCVCGEPNSAGTHRTDGPCLAPQPEQEPVAWMHTKIEGVAVPHRPADLDKHPDRWDALYKAPPPCPTCEALARTVMMDQTGRDA